MGDDGDEPQMPSTDEVPDVCAYAFLDEVTDENQPSGEAGASVAAAETEAIATETIKRTFRAVDSNGDGLISMEELKVVFQNLGDWSDDDFDTLMSAADQDADGKLKFDEFVDWIMDSGVDSDSLNMAPAYAQALAESAAETAEAARAQEESEKPVDSYESYLQSSHAQAVAEYAEGTLATTLNSFDELKICEQLDVVTELSLTPIGNFNMENDGRYTVDMLLKLKPFTSQLTSLKRLVLSDNQFGDAAMPALASCLQCLSRLEILELLSNDLTMVGCTTVIEALSQDALPNLTKVSMHTNPVQDDDDAVATLTASFRELRGEGDMAELLISAQAFDW